MLENRTVFKENIILFLHRKYYGFLFVLFLFLGFYFSIVILTIVIYMNPNYVFIFFTLLALATMITLIFALRLIIVKSRRRKRIMLIINSGVYLSILEPFINISSINEIKYYTKLRLLTVNIDGRNIGVENIYGPTIQNLCNVLLKYNVDIIIENTSTFDWKSINIY